MTGELIELRGQENFVTQEERSAYRLVSGCVRVYIAPWTGSGTERMALLCEVTQGLIPSFVFRDRDYQEWRFVFVAQGQAQLQEMPDSVTSVLQRNFLKKAGLSNVEQEGFANCLVEHYRLEIVKDEVFIERGRRREPEARIASYGAIRDAFESQDAPIAGDNPAYRAVAFACGNLKIDVVPFDRVNASCGENAHITDVARLSHIICRKVVLEPGWYRKDTGVIIGKIGDELVTCVPANRGSYRIYHTVSGVTEKLSKEMAETISPQAYILNRTLPNQKLETRDLFRFGIKTMSKWDMGAILLLGLVSTLIGVLLPVLNQKIYDDYIPLGNISQLAQICLVIGTFMIGNLFFSIVKSIAEFRLESTVGYAFQEAAYYRILRLPESFFRNHESADLAQRLTQISSSVNQFVSATVITGISTLFSLLYLFRMFRYTARLSWVALLMVAAYSILVALTSIGTLRYERTSVENRGEASSRLYQYLGGIEKIRMAGVEERAAYEYLLPFAAVQSADIRKNRISSIGTVLSGVATTVFSMVLYVIIVRGKLDVTMGSFIGFNTALGAFTGAALGLIGKLMDIYRLKPTFERFKPILDTQPEDGASDELPGTLSGEVSVEHITFRYAPGRPAVLNDLSLHIRKGEYLGIVGASGCGKSTLLKLLLGFETPESGQISFDGKALDTMDKQSFRQNLGVVLQNGKLISGSIYDNITITAPDATMKNVQNVIEAVGLKEDIAQMPMGLHTELSENSGTISGGQQQRILIARAIIRNPSILIFDEATSALDNVTQAAVTESLDRMNVTRIVVAHRLSTIRGCDRIIVLDRGSIVEEGDYENLMKKRGLFYQLASRQIAE